MNAGNTVHRTDPALHRVAVVRLHTDQRTRDYTASRRAAGKTSKEILRCLKRAIAREVYRLFAVERGS